MTTTPTNTGRAAPGPPSGYFLAFLWFRRDPLGFLQRLTRKYGDVAEFRSFGRSILLVNHPDHIRDVLTTQNANFVKGRALDKARRLLGSGLLTSEGDLHRSQRRLVLPAFHRQRIASYATVMTDRAMAASARWKPGATFDMNHEMTRLTLGIVAKTLFDADVDDEADEIGEAMTTVLEMFNLMMYPLADLIEKLPLPMTRRYQKMRSRLDSMIYEIINERRKSKADRGDLLSMLLLAQDEESGGTMTDLQVRDEAMTLFLAGHETTSNALSWTWFLLAQNPDAENRLHAELDEVLAGGRMPSMEDLPRLQYTEKVIHESMRLFPPAWAMGRRSIVDQTVGGYAVPKGAIVLLSPWVTHRDARFFPEPETFKPERWSAEFRESLPPFAYFPFGGGPRRCIGESFAWSELILVLAVLASRWRARLDPSQKVRTQPLLTLRPKNGIRMTVESRSGC